jgi:Zn finger protein HypA/HybF involved in hydrogenase expression
MVNYYCETCIKDVLETEVISGECPWCREKRFRHKICGTRVYPKVS